MAGTRTHNCVFFDDDGWLEAACDCGQRAAYLVEDEDWGPTLVLLEDAPRGRAPHLRADSAGHLAVSA